MKPLYVLRSRNPNDGSWTFEMGHPMTKKEAEYEAKKSRILFGVLCQVWTEKEAAPLALAEQEKREASHV